MNSSAQQLRANIASIIDHDEDLVVATHAGSAHIKPAAQLRKDRSRMIFMFNVKEGVDISQAWLQDHAEVVKTAPMAKNIIKYEQVREYKLTAVEICHPPYVLIATSCRNSDWTNRQS